MHTSPLSSPPWSPLLITPCRPLSLPKRLICCLCLMVQHRHSLATLPPPLNTPALDAPPKTRPVVTLPILKRLSLDTVSQPHNLWLVTLQRMSLGTMGLNELRPTINRRSQVPYPPHPRIHPSVVTMQSISSRMFLATPQPSPSLHSLVTHPQQHSQRLLGTVPSISLVVMPPTLSQRSLAICLQPHNPQPLAKCFLRVTSLLLPTPLDMMCRCLMPLSNPLIGQLPRQHPHQRLLESTNSQHPTPKTAANLSETGQGSFWRSYIFPA